MEQIPMTPFITLVASTALLSLVGPSLAQAVGNDQRQGQRFEVSASELPKPYADKAKRASSTRVERGDSTPIAPNGFKVALFAQGLENPRKLLVLDNGD